MERLYDLSRTGRMAYIKLIESTIMLNICAKMAEKERRLTSDEIEQIIHKEFEELRESV